ncbi:hypothetical protein O9K51_09834 [Purpureocillium lavendulum]|uniref:Uncharacterized protein n=1 Tax=Purpureocillium lavendulum TaxID=1247861 RepID=A0AB34FGJ1_9HYPO|nr:hypothetical protein O9K51_09831 [Purpureocillium lavendulum]KAJ6437627.1 hypothetical protein O9K51_09834 [Purpureocillium lavendulum]
MNNHGRAIAGIQSKLRADDAATNERWEEATRDMNGSLARLSTEVVRQGDALRTVQASLAASGEGTARAAQQVHDSLHGISASLDDNRAQARSLEAALLGDGGVKHSVQALQDLLAEVRDALVDTRPANDMLSKLETLARDLAAEHDVARESLCVLRTLHADIGRLCESHVEFCRAAARVERGDDMARFTEDITGAMGGLRDAVAGGEALRAVVSELSGKIAVVPAAAPGYISWTRSARATRAEESRHAGSLVEEEDTAHEWSGYRVNGPVHGRGPKNKAGSCSVMARARQGTPPDGEQKGIVGGVRRRSQRLMGRAGATRATGPRKL